MYSREDTVKMLLARKADPTTLGGPKAQSCVHLVCSRQHHSVRSLISDPFLS